MIIEALTLPEAFEKAAKEFGCTAANLDIKVIQHPSAGFFGFFKKNAIIEVDSPDGYKPQTTPKNRSNEPKVEVDSVILTIKDGVVKLISSSCFAIEVKNVTKYDEQTVLIEIDGEDAALLIGKEGYRYKAFSYLLYNWVNMKYNLGIRLEIAEFLKNQETMIDSYLQGVIERVESQGRGQTRPLDGVLIKIALEKLRAKFPEKYVGIKTGKEGRKFIVVNDFNRKNS